MITWLIIGFLVALGLFGFILASISLWKLDKGLRDIHTKLENLIARLKQ